MGSTTLRSHFLGCSWPMTECSMGAQAGPFQWARGCPVDGFGLSISDSLGESFLKLCCRPGLFLPESSFLLSPSNMSSEHHSLKLLPSFSCSFLQPASCMPHPVLMPGFRNLGECSSSPSVSIPRRRKLATFMLQASGCLLLQDEVMLFKKWR